MQASLCDSSSYNMRVLTYVLTSLLVIVTSFNIRSNDNSIDNPTTHPRIKKLWNELKHLQTEFQQEYDETDDENDDDDELIKDTDKKIHSDIAFVISPHAISYFWHQMMASIRHDALRQSTISFQTSYLEFDVRVDAIQIVDFQPPTIHMRSTKDRIQIRTEGGQAKLLGLYYGKYRTIREGQLEAIIEDLHVNLDINRNNEGKLMAIDSDCSHSIGSVEITLRPILPAQIADTIRDEIIARVARRICPAVTSFANRIFKTAQTSLILPRPLPTSTDSIHYKFSHTEANDQSVIISHENQEDNSNDVVRLPNKPTTMTTIAVSENFINNYFDELNNKGDTIFNFHHIEPIKKMLQTHCHQDDVCIGNVLDLPKAIEGTGRLDARCIQSPKITFSEDKAHLKLDLHFELTYEQADTESRQVYLSFHAPLNLRVKNVEVIALSEGKYQWKADYTIEDISFGKIRQKEFHVSNIQTILEEFTADHIDDIESLLSTYLGGNLPVFTNHNIHFKQHNKIRFTNSQLTLQADFKVNRALFPVFDFSF